jgi:hypothetical protein
MSDLLFRPFFKPKIFKQLSIKEFEMIYSKFSANVSDFNSIFIINENKNLINWKLLSKNKNAISILENNLDKIYMTELTLNKNATKLIEKILDIYLNIDIYNLSKNDIHFLTNLFKEDEIEKYFTCYQFKIKYPDFIMPNKISKKFNDLLKDYPEISISIYEFFKTMYLIHLLDNPKALYLINKYNKYLNFDINSVYIKILLKYNLDINLIKQEQLFKLFQLIYMINNNKKIDEYLNDESSINLLNWNLISENENLIKLIEKNVDKINWYYLSKNPKAIEILKKNPDKIYWNNLCKNPNAIEILELYPENINWTLLCENPNAIHILEKNMDKIDLFSILCNPNAFSLIKKIYYRYLNEIFNNNSSYKIKYEFINHIITIYPYNNNITLFLHLIFEYIEDIYLASVLENPYCLSFILENINQFQSFDLFYIARYNENAVTFFFDYDYSKMSLNNLNFKLELYEKIHSPIHIQNIIQQYNIDFINYLNLIN